MMNTIDRDWLLELLRQGEIEVTFTKADGTDRIMKCTLQEGVVVPHEKKTERTKEPNADILPVWDIEKQAWRSFKLSSIKAVGVSAEAVHQVMEHQ
jgi:hypothetical protein